MLNKRELGSRYEQLAAADLESRGLKILERNFWCRSGEIDIIARDEDTLVLLEVKYRQDHQSGFPAEAVTLSKQRAICKTAAYYMLIRQIPQDFPCRFDVVTVEGARVEWIQNAFGGF